MQRGIHLYLYINIYLLQELWIWVWFHCSRTLLVQTWPGQRPHTLCKAWHAAGGTHLYLSVLCSKAKRKNRSKFLETNYSLMKIRFLTLATIISQQLMWSNETYTNFLSLLAFLCSIYCLRLHIVNCCPRAFIRVLGLLNHYFNLYNNRWALSWNHTTKTHDL